MSGFKSLHLEHGGNIRTVAKQYGIAESEWLDLSTGVNPQPWPVPAVPQVEWSRLPEDNDGLVDAAVQYYHAPHLLPVAGSQAAIRALPRLRAPSRVAVLTPCFSEHAWAWEQAGHDVHLLKAEQIMSAAHFYDVVVLANPNNPTGQRFNNTRLLQMRQDLAARGGWLVVDEAFMDATPMYSLCPHSDLAGLIVLRSVGKFFGLAGARIGFVCAQPLLLDALARELGPWTVSSPARWLLQHAFKDQTWQQQARMYLMQQSQQLAQVLHTQGLAPSAGCAFFQWVNPVNAQAWQQHLARQGIWVRSFPEVASLRFGLPANNQQMQRLQHALSHVSEFLHAS